MMMEFNDLFRREDGVATTTTAVTVPLPLTPALSAKGERAHLNASLLLMIVL